MIEQVPPSRQEHRSAASPSVRAAALAAHAQGFSVLPPCEDGTKRPWCPDGEWKHYQATRASLDEVSSWYGTKGTPKRSGLGLITGSVSRQLSLLEFDCHETYLLFKEAAAALGLGELVTRIESGYREDTPGGGVHWLVFCPGTRNSTKLARRHKTPEEYTEEDRKVIEAAQAQGRTHRPVRVLIETKDEGGYVIVAPSNGQVHSTGGTYTLGSGGFDAIATLTPEDLEDLWNLARTFDRMPEPERPAQAARPQAGHWGGAIPVWDDYNARTNWPEMMPSGWVKVYQRGECEYWRRPGKTKGHSATINRNGSDRLYVFTSSTEFTPNDYYDRCDVYAVLNHGGDHKAANQVLSQAGYGSFMAWVWDRERAKWRLQPHPNPCPKGGLVRIAQQGEGPPPPPKGNGTVPPGDRTATDGPSAHRPEDGWRLDVVNSGLILPEPVRYLSRPFLPRSMVVMLAGLGGEGKSQLLIHIMACGSTGRPCFGQPRADLEAFHSLLLACEDGQKDTLAPRLIAAGADRNRVDIIQGLVNQKGQTIPFDISYLSYLREHIEEGRKAGKDYRVVGIDPITTYVGRAKIDDHRDAQLKPALEGLVSIAQDLGITFLCSAHLNKGGPGKSAIYRIMGGSSYVNTARITYVLGRDPGDETRRILASPKCNLPIWPPAIALRLETFEPAEARTILAPHVGHLDETDRRELEGQLSRVRFDGEVSISADDVLGTVKPKEVPNHISRATDWLRNRLKDGPAGSVLVAMQGDRELEIPWPKRDMDPERRRIAIATRVKWWHETILKARLSGRSRKLGMGGIWFFVLDQHQWPPPLTAQNDATKIEIAEAAAAE